MKRVNTKATSRVETENGIKVVIWTKICPICHKPYETSVRHQKYCSDKCSERAQKKKARQQKEYNETKEVRRLSARAHSLAVETINQLVHMGKIEKKCELCGSTDHLQIHHKDVQWLNNDPTNLQILCNKCHTQVHTKLDVVQDDLSAAIYNVILR